MIRPAYNWLMRQAAGSHAPFVLFMLAVSESVFLPIPPDVMLAPMVLAKPSHAWRNAIICALGSVAGGCASYAIGYYFEPYAFQLLALTGAHVDKLEYQKLFHDWGFLLILGKGITPIPYMIITFAAGLAHFVFWQFVVASLITRSGRFLLTAYLVKRFGPQLQERFERNIALWGSLLIALLVAIWAAIHFLPGLMGY